MSRAKLKKYLQTLPKEQVIEVILELYDARKEAKDYLEFYLTPDRKAFVHQMPESHFRFSEVKARPKLRSRPNAILHRTRMRIYRDIRRYVGSILHDFGKQFRQSNEVYLHERFVGEIL